MGKFRLLFIAGVILFLPHIVFSDIIVTTDGMTLNGKIIEDIKNDHVKFGTYHGIFTIYYDQIREKHKTDNYQEDIKIFKDMGKTVSEAEIKTNYQAGIKKLEEKQIRDKKARAASTKYLLLVSPFFNFNLGKIQTLLPYSFGAFLMGDVRVQSKYRFLPSTVRIDLHYFHSEKGIKKISAFRFGLGTAWIFPLEGRGFHVNLTLSPVFGGGYYAVTGRDGNTGGFKWHASLSFGPEFNISSWVISPQVRFDYIYDGAAPLYGIGISIGAGYFFNI